MKAFFAVSFVSILAVCHGDNALDGRIRTAAQISFDSANRHLQSYRPVSALVDALAGIMVARSGKPAGDGHEFSITASTGPNEFGNIPANSPSYETPAPSFQYADHSNFQSAGYFPQQQTVGGTYQFQQPQQQAHFNQGGPQSYEHLPTHQGHLSATTQFPGKPLYSEVLKGSKVRAQQYGQGLTEEQQYSQQYPQQYPQRAQLSQQHPGYKHSGNQHPVKQQFFEQQQQQYAGPQQHPYPQPHTHQQPYPGENPAQQQFSGPQQHLHPRLYPHRQAHQRLNPGQHPGQHPGPQQQQQNQQFNGAPQHEAYQQPGPHQGQQPYGY